jgi:hypothetical protein
MFNSMPLPLDSPTALVILLISIKKKKQAFSLLFLLQKDDSTPTKQYQAIRPSPPLPLLPSPTLLFGSPVIWNFDEKSMQGMSPWASAFPWAKLPGLPSPQAPSQSL